MITESSATPPPSNFIREIVASDLASGAIQKLVTRFPPEPNGYLHIGHAKSICLNFGIARDFSGVCHLRMDDTNPAKEDTEYVDSIIADVRWLIADWAEDVLRFKSATDPFFASDYFEQIYGYAVDLVQNGKAYVCDLTAEQTDEYRGAPDQPGRPSPYRDRSCEENLALLTEMRAGAFPDGARTLRAKIDPQHPNVWLRDPVLYRIRHTAHHQTGDTWCIYPMYDFAHGLSDSIEGVTHSICTLEFEVHRPLYNWLLQSLPVPSPRPQQIEFARLGLTYTLLSKRKLLALVAEGHVSGWDDPRMPTLSGLRRRGVTAAALRQFAIQVGVTKYHGLTEVGVLEHAIREDLNTRAERRMGVLNPLKIVITNLPEDHPDTLPATNHPLNPELGTRPLPFSREIYIEADDFAEVPPPKFFRLKPGGEVRLKYAYIIQCHEVIKNPDGSIAELRCTADLESRSGGATSSRKIKGTIHWVSAPHAVPTEIRLYDRLFTESEPESGGSDFRASLNPESLIIVTAQLEPSLASALPDERFQLERLAYITPDPILSQPGRPVFNRIITLKDTWAKETGKS